MVEQFGDLCQEYLHTGDTEYPYGKCFMMLPCKREHLHIPHDQLPFALLSQT